MIFTCLEDDKKNKDKEYAMETTQNLQSLQYVLFGPLQNKFATPDGKDELEEEIWCGKTSLRSAIIIILGQK